MDEEELISIGEFAALTRLSIKALRLYDDNGLLTPAHVDPVSSYRYYRRNQRNRAILIGDLRRVDVPLALIAQILGGKYDLPHGALNAVALPHSLRFNQPYAADAIRRLGEAMGTDDPAGKCAELGALGCAMRFRDYNIPEGDLPEVAAQIAERPANKTNPKPASAEEVLDVLRAAW